MGVTREQREGVPSFLTLSFRFWTKREGEGGVEVGAGGGAMAGVVFNTRGREEGESRWCEIDGRNSNTRAS